MRSDMVKLLTEAERYGSSNPSKKWGKRLKYDPDSDYEQEVTRISTSRSNTQLRKSSLANLNPLERYLRKNLRRPWNKIYSEVSQNFDRSTVSGNYMFEHLWDLVAKNCWIEAKTGQVFSQYNCGSRMYKVNGFYVHPKTGLLREQKNPSRKQRLAEEAKKPVKEIKISGTEKYLKEEGIWYYIEKYDINREYKYVTKPSYFYGCETEDEKKVAEVEWILDGKPAQKPIERTAVHVDHVYNKRQLNAKELQKLNLQNDPKEAKPLSRRESRRRKLLG